MVRSGVLACQFKDCPTKAPLIGKRVEIGAGTHVLDEVAMGDDALIGANVVFVEMYRRARLCSACLPALRRIRIR